MRSRATSIAALAAAVLAIGVAGGQAADRSPRIIHGHPASIADFPWQVGLAQNPEFTRGGSPFRRTICGGTLVAPTLVITAAHCVYHHGFQPAKFFDVISGRTSLNDESQGLEQPVAGLFAPTNAKGKPLYKSGSVKWDAVLLQLSEPAAGQPIPIAGPSERSLWAKGAPAMISGWGSLTRRRDYPDDLHAGNIKIVSDRTCGREFNVFDSTVQMCASAKPTDTCPGDSGGPLVVLAADGTPRLVGDTSYGLACGTAKGGVYGRLAADPMRSKLQQMALDVAGVDIVSPG